MYYLGVDGGGTKTSFALMDGGGSILAAATKGNADMLRMGREIFRETLDSGVAQVCNAAGILRSEIAYSVFGITCLGDEIIEDIPIVEGIIREMMQSDSFLAINDVEVGWAGSLACQPGLHLVAGTGAIGYGVDNKGNAERSSGWGPEIGDEGSAFWLGLKLLSLFTRETDGREPKSGIYEMIRKEFRLNNNYELLQILYQDMKMKRESVAALSVLLHQLALAGESKAIRVFEEAANELGHVVKSLIYRLQFAEGVEIPVSYSGGVFKSGRFILEPLQRALEEYPVRLIQPCMQPVMGAALYAYKKLHPSADLSELIRTLQIQEGV